MANAKREIAEKQIYDFMNTLDPTGYNAAKYKEMFTPMSDNEFEQYMRDMDTKEDHNLFYEINTMGKQGYPNMKEIGKIAKKYQVKLTERVFFPHKNPENPELPGCTATEVPILMFPVRRLQQMADKKNSASGNISTVNPIIGQVTGESKSASLSDMQTCSLVSSGQLEAVKEFLGPRADDQHAKKQMLESIENYGQCTLADMHLDVDDKQSIETMKVFLMGGGIYSSFKE